VTGFLSRPIRGAAFAAVFELRSGDPKTLFRTITSDESGAFGSCVSRSDEVELRRTTGCRRSSSSTG